MKPSSVAEAYSAISAEHDIRLSHIRIAAIANKELVHTGWIFPGGKIITSKREALKLAKQINKELFNEQCNAV
jgi:hypothetical protein